MRHTSAGRVPTGTGLRLFVDGLMEFDRDLQCDERSTIDGECAARGISPTQLLDNASKTLSGLSIVPVWCCHQKVRLICSILNSCLLGQRALAVLVRTDGQVENRLIDLPVGLPASALTKAANYMNAKLANRNMRAAVLIKNERSPR